MTGVEERSDPRYARYVDLAADVAAWQEDRRAEAIEAGVPVEFVETSGAIIFIATAAIFPEWARAISEIMVGVMEYDGKTVSDLLSRAIEITAAIRA